MDFEKQAFASCHHPFIINLDYAFQTDSCAIFVLDLANGMLTINNALCQHDWFKNPSWRFKSSDQSFANELFVGGESGVLCGRMCSGIKLHAPTRADVQRSQGTWTY